MTSKLFFSLWCLFQSTLALTTNITIDDSSPDPRTGKPIVYSPVSAWNTGTNCQRGPGKCTAAPSADSLNGGTWHESTFNPVDSSSNDFPNTPLTATVQFDGTAVYVFCALALTTSGPSGNSDMTFIIDGQAVGNFVRPAPNLPGYEPNVLVYSNNLLPPGPHVMNIINGRVNGTKSLIIIDQIIYTFETDSTLSPSPSSTTGIPIVGTPVTRSSSHGLDTWPGHLTSFPSLNSSMNPTSSGHEALSTGSGLPVNPSTPSSPSSPKSSTPSLGVMIGAALAPSLAMLVVGIIILLICRRRRKRAHAAAMQFSRTYRIPRSGPHITSHRDSPYYTHTPIDQFSSLQLPSPAYSSRPFTFGSTTNSPTSPGASDPLRAVRYDEALVNRGLTGQGWAVASDSKRDLLEASRAVPPAYYD